MAPMMESVIQYNEVSTCRKFLILLSIVLAQLLMDSSITVDVKVNKMAKLEILVEKLS
jgi:hypothetical protein